MAGRWRSLLPLCLLTSAIAPVFPSSGSETVTYSYDGRGRLVKVVRTGVTGVQTDYGYDKADNRTSVTVATSTPTFSINSAAATEGSPVVFTVTKAGSTSATLTVNYATAAGTAGAADFTAGSGTLTFLAGDTSKPVSIATIDDSGVEGTESFTVTLSSPSAGSVIGAATGTGTINDNDSAPTCGGVSFAIAAGAAVTEGGSPVFTVTKAGTASGSCTINYATANGTAAAGSDFTAASGSLTFAAVDTVKTFTVATIDDAAVESAETFSASLSAPSGGAVLGSPSSATATINDNDSGGGTGCGGVSFRVNDVANDEGVPLVFTITKTGATSSSCSVNYASANGTAITPNDYAAVSGTLTFTSAQTTKTVSISTVVAGPGESTEYMYLNLSGASGGATVSDPQGVGTIYNYFDDGGCPLC